MNYKKHENVSYVWINITCLFAWWIEMRMEIKARVSYADVVLWKRAWCGERKLHQVVASSGIDVDEQSARLFSFLISSNLINFFFIFMKETYTIRN